MKQQKNRRHRNSDACINNDIFGIIHYDQVSIQLIVPIHYLNQMLDYF